MILAPTGLTQQRLLRGEFHDMYGGTPHFTAEEFEDRYYYQSQLKGIWAQKLDDKGKTIPWSDAPDELQRYSMAQPPITEGIKDCEIVVCPTSLHGNIRAIELAMILALSIIDKKNDWYDTLYSSLKKSDGYQTYGRIHASGQLLYGIVHQLSNFFYDLC